MPSLKKICYSRHHGESPPPLPLPLLLPDHKDDIQDDESKEDKQEEEESQSLLALAKQQSRESRHQLRRHKWPPYSCPQAAVPVYFPHVCFWCELKNFVLQTTTNTCNGRQVANYLNRAKEKKNGSQSQGRNEGTLSMGAGL